MKHLLIFVLAAAIVPSILGQTLDRQTNQNSGVEQGLMKLEREKDEAKKTGDRVTLDRIYADDFIAWNAKGGVSGKRELLEHFTARGSVYESFKSEDISVRVYGDTAVVTGRISFKYNKEKMKGKDSDQYRYINVYVKRQDAWQIVAAQFTRIDK